MEQEISPDDEVVKAPGVDVLSLPEILEAGNLAERLSDNVLNAIGAAVIRDVEIDQTSRRDWLQRYQGWIDTAMQVAVPKNSPWQGASNVKFPLLTTASIQFQARAYPAIVDGSNLVRGKVLGPDPDGAKRALADRIGQHMTWQLLYKMPGWEEETDRLLLLLPIVGCVIRKTYFDPVANANCSEIVPADKFIINYWSKGIDKAPRFTHELEFYPYEVRERVLSGQWRDVPTQPSEGQDDDSPIIFYEQHRMHDLDGDGYPEPYVVTTTEQGDVARIVPCFGPEHVTISEDGETVIKIERREYFTKYSFIPAPDGSFYDVGFGHLLEAIGASVNTTINQMLDAGTLQNSGGGFVGDGVQIRGGNMTFRLGEWKRVNVTGGNLAQNIVPMPAPGPSSVLFTLLGMMIDAAKQVTSVQDVTVGQGTANQPATTTLALIEQGMKVMTGIFKRIHRSFGQELRILRRLNKDFLDEQEYFELNDGSDVSVTREDYSVDGLDVVPVSDPNSASDMQKLARAEALMVFNGDPLINQEELRRRYLEGIGERDIKTLMTAPKAAPDPALLVEGMKQEIAKSKAEADNAAKYASAAKALSDAAARFNEMGLFDDAAIMAELAASIGGEVEQAEVSNQPGDDANMEGPAGDGGMVPDDGGLAGGIAGLMGPGEPDVGGGAGAGGDIDTAIGVDG
jgi:chaperonin GroES